MNEIQIIKEQEVLGKNFKIYGDFENPLFLAKDVAEWIEHSDVSTMIRSIDDDEKVTNNVCTLGGTQKAWFLTEDGLYEVLMQSRKPIAKEFKKQIKVILKEIRKTGNYSVKPQYVPTEYEIKQQKLEISKLFEKIANNYDGKSKQILEAYAVKELSGEFLLPLPEQKKTYSASEIGNMLGVSSNKIGKISNQYNLKVDKYGEWFRDKSQYSNKEVRSFRYYDEVLPEMKKILKEEAVI